MGVLDKNSKKHLYLTIIFCIIYFLVSVIYYPVTSFIGEVFNISYFECNFKNWFNIPCPTCGGSRSAYYFVVLNFKKSFEMNSGVFLASFYIFFVFLYAINSLVLKKIFDTSKIFKILYMKIFLCIIFLQWLVKIF